jgi:hypothetical protein
MRATVETATKDNPTFVTGLEPVGVIRDLGHADSIMASGHMRRTKRPDT